MYNFWEPISGLGMDRKTSSFWSQESLYWSRKLKFILNVFFPLISFAFLRKYTPKKSVLVPLLDLSHDIYLPLSSHQLHFPHSFFSSPLFPTYFLIWKSPTVVPSSIPNSVAPSVWSPGRSAAIFFHGHHCRHHTQGEFFHLWIYKFCFIISRWTNPRLVEGDHYYNIRWFKNPIWLQRTVKIKWAIFLKVLMSRSWFLTATISLNVSGARGTLTAWRSV